MLDSLTPVLGVVVVFGLVIFVHELGHFMAAKLMGVYAPRFSIGFGPALWRRKWGETEYILAALPLGGYVRMASREDQATAFLEGGSEEPARGPATVGAGGEGRVFDDEQVVGQPRDWDPEAMMPFGPRPIPEHRWFESKSLPARIFILLAGVTMNIALALVVMIGLAATYGRQIIPTRVIGGIAAVDEAPPPVGLQAGDTILAVNGTPVETWNEITSAIVRGTGREITFQLHRGEVVVPVGGPDLPAREQVALSLEPYYPPVIESVVTGSPAQRAGMRGGDSVVAVDDQPLRSWQEMVERISASAGVPLTIDLIRDGQPEQIVVEPEPTEIRDARGRREVGRIGASVRPLVVREPVGLGEAAVVGWDATWGMTTWVLDALRRIAMREVALDNLGGPIAIAQVTAQATRSGMQSFLSLLALISVNIAIFNLLPIPILDGGQILLNVAESIKGGSFSARTREYILRAGLLMIALLFVLVMYNDIRRLVRSFFL
ncbi:MAG TPA: RIP metalloprotease RseP [Gemmatimonadaceae bacterium]|nr:RIP metalloprotease RseP [Gemmatimonadaceae bacterium]